MEGSPHRWTYIYSAVLGLVISSLEFINVWLTVWLNVQVWAYKVTDKSAERLCSLCGRKEKRSFC